MRPVVDVDGAVETLANEHAAFGHAEAERLTLDLEPELAKDDRVVIADHALMVFGEDLVEVCTDSRYERRSLFSRGDGEVAVVLREVRWQILVCRLNARDASTTHLLREPSLERPVRTFTSAARLRGPGRDGLNAELLERPAYLRADRPVGRLRTLRRAEEVRRPIAVKRAERPFPLDYRSDRFHDRFGVLFLDEPCVVDLARGVVHDRHQVELVVIGPEPGVRAAVAVQH